MKKAFVRCPSLPWSHFKWVIEFCRLYTWSKLEVLWEYFIAYSHCLEASDLINSILFWKFSENSQVCCLLLKYVNLKTVRLPLVPWLSVFCWSSCSLLWIVGKDSQTAGPVERTVELLMNDVFPGIWQTIAIQYEATPTIDRRIASFSGKKTTSFSLLSRINVYVHTYIMSLYKDGMISVFF